MSASDLKQQGNAAFSAGRFEEAVDFFTKAIQLSPEDHILYSNRSGAYASLYQYDKALEDGEKVISLKPDWAKGYSRKGLALQQMSRYKEARDTYQKGLALDGSNKACLDGIDECNKMLKKSTLDSQLIIGLMKLLEEPKFKQYQAEDPEFMTKVLGVMQNIVADPNPQNLGLLSSLPDARVREAISRLLGAPAQEDGGFSEQTTTTAASSSEKTPTTSSGKDKDVPMTEVLSGPAAEAEKLKAEANELYLKKRFEEALELYDKAIELNPQEILYYGNKGAVYIEMQKYDECLKVCQLALDKRYEIGASFEKVAKIYNRMAACYMHMGDFQNCVLMYEKSLTEDNNRKTRNLLRDAQRMMDKQKQEAYINPELAEVHRNKGNELFKQQDYPAAKAQYDEAISRNPKDPKAYSNRAAAFMNLFEYPSAMKDCEKCLELDPNFIRAWSRKGQIHLKLKEYHKALSAFEKGLAIDSENADCKNGLQQTMMAINAMHGSGQVDEDQVNRAMADPEIQKILNDPQFRLILSQVSQDPQRLPEFLNDPKIASALNKLIAAGILKVM